MERLNQFRDMSVLGLAPGRVSCQQVVGRRQGQTECAAARKTRGAGGDVEREKIDK